MSSLREEAGSLYLQMGRWREAVTHYEATRPAQSRVASVHFNLATALMLAGRLEDAMARYLEALRLKPDYAAAHSNLGNVLSRLGRVDDALAEYQAAVRADPGHAGAHNNVGYLLMRRGELDAANVHFDEAIGLDPRLPDAHYNLGLLFQARGDGPPAIAISAALAIKPDWAGRVDGAELDARDDVRPAAPRRPAEAIRLAARAVTLTNGRVRTRSMRSAAAYAEASQFDRALEALEEALRLASGTAAAASMVERRDLYGKRRPDRHSPRSRRRRRFRPSLTASGEQGDYFTVTVTSS